MTFPRIIQHSFPPPSIPRNLNLLPALFPQVKAQQRYISDASRKNSFRRRLSLINWNQREAVRRRRAIAEKREVISKEGRASEDFTKKAEETSVKDNPVGNTVVEETSGRGLSRQGILRILHPEEFQRIQHRDQFETYYNEFQAFKRQFNLLATTVEGVQTKLLRPENYPLAIRDFVAQRAIQLETESGVAARSTLPVGDEPDSFILLTVLKVVYGLHFDKADQLFSKLDRKPDRRKIKSSQCWYYALTHKLNAAPSIDQESDKAESTLSQVVQEETEPGQLNEQYHGPQPSKIAQALQHYDLRSDPQSSGRGLENIVEVRSGSVTCDNPKKPQDDCGSSDPLGLTRLSQGLPIKGVRNLVFFKTPQEQKYQQAVPDSRQDSRMKASAQFITTPTADTPGTSILLHFENKRYLIGHVGEGTQRACMEQKQSLLKVSDVFVSGKIDWSTTGGLFGLILTVADGKASAAEQTRIALNAANKSGKNARKHDTSDGSSKLHLHGGRNLTHMIATARKFVSRRGLPLEIEEYRDSETITTIEGNIAPTFADDLIRAWPMTVLPDAIAPPSRKRSFEEMDGERETHGLESSSRGAEEQDKKDNYDYQTSRAVVASMFDSSWSLDALTAIKLQDVKMPATIFTRKQNGEVEEYTGPRPGGDIPVPDIEVWVREPWPASKVDTLPRSLPSNASTSYIIKSNAIRGKFDAATAKKLNLNPAQDYKRLIAGETIISKDGRTVTPDMVLGPSSIGTGFAVIDIPDPSYVQGILSRPEFNSEKVMEGVKAFIWILGPGVHADTRLLKFMATKDVSHIISSPDLGANELAFGSAASQAICRNVIDGERFPIPHFTNVPVAGTPDVPNSIVARAGKMFTLVPEFSVSDRFTGDECEPSKAVESVDMEVTMLADEAKTTVESTQYLTELEKVQQDMPCLDAEITTLGTGSSLPSKQRNVSANMLRVPGYGNYLLDAGENTLGQLYRVFGPELPQILRELRMIWISHLHADHHLGTASVIKAWHDATKDDPSTKDNKLLVAAPAGMLQWLREYSDVEDIGHHRVMPVAAAENNGKICTKNMTAYQREAFQLEKIETVRVQHCFDAFAVVLTWPNGFKVAYSGDCRPSQDFARVGRGATLLIHEATFDDDMIGDALQKRHSTTGEAVEVGRQMGARRIILTHFSQRYSKIPVMENTDGGDQVVVVAFDYMQCKIGDLKKVAEFRPALLKLYEMQDEEAVREKAENARLEAERLAEIEEKKNVKKQEKTSKKQIHKQGYKSLDLEGSWNTTEAEVVPSSTGQTSVDTSEQPAKASVDAADQQDIGSEITRRLQTPLDEPVDLEDVRKLSLKQLMANSGYEIEDTTGNGTS